jgi:hypothetical protein
MAAALKKDAHMSDWHYNHVTGGRLGNTLRDGFWSGFSAHVRVNSVQDDFEPVGHFLISPGQDINNIAKDFRKSLKRLHENQ